MEKELVTKIVSGAHWAYRIRLEVEISKAPGQAMPTNLRHGTTKLKFKPVLFKDGL